MSGEITIDEDSFEGWKGMMDAINPMKVKLNFLLLGIPVALYAKFGLHDAGLTFLASMVAIMPLAFLMGKATEEIALRTSESIGGLLNATFGNAAEMIIAGAAIFAAAELAGDGEISASEDMINIVRDTSMQLEETFQSKRFSVCHISQRLFSLSFMGYSCCSNFEHIRNSLQRMGNITMMIL